MYFLDLIVPFLNNDISSLVFKSIDNNNNMDSTSAFIRYNQQQFNLPLNSSSILNSSSTEYQQNHNNTTTLSTYMLDSTPFYPNYHFINSTVVNLF